MSLALASAVLFGASAPFAKVLLGTVDTQLLAGLMYLGAGLGLAIVHFGRAAIGLPAQEAPLRRGGLPRGLRPSSSPVASPGRCCSCWVSRGPRPRPDRSSSTGPTPYALDRPPNGWLGRLTYLVAIDLPSFLLLIGVLPFRDTLRGREDVQSALRGGNAAVVGLLLAALYTPVWTGGITSTLDLAIGLVAFLLLVFWRVPPWLVVILGAATGSALAI